MSQELQANLNRMATAIESTSTQVANHCTNTQALSEQVRTNRDGIDAINP